MERSQVSPAQQPQGCLKKFHSAVHIPT